MSMALERPESDNREVLLGNRNSISAPIEGEELKRRFPGGIMYFQGRDKRGGSVLVGLKDEVDRTPVEPTPAPDSRKIGRKIIRPQLDLFPSGSVGEYWVIIPQITYGGTLPDSEDEQKRLRDQINQEVFGIDTSKTPYLKPLKVFVLG